MDNQGDAIKSPAVNQQPGVLSRRLDHMDVLRNSMRSEVRRQIAAWAAM